MPEKRALKKHNDSKLEENRPYRPEEAIVADKLNKLMRDRKIKAYDLAKECEFSASKISDFRSAKITMSIVDLMKLSKILNVTPDFLLGFTEEQQYNPDARIAAEYTGLSPEAVEKLHDMTTCPEDGKKTFKKYYQSISRKISEMITSHAFGSFIRTAIDQQKVVKKAEGFVAEENAIAKARDEAIASGSFTKAAWKPLIHDAIEKSKLMDHLLDSNKDLKFQKFTVMEEAEKLFPEYDSDNLWLQVQNSIHRFNSIIDEVNALSDDTNE